MYEREPQGGVMRHTDSMARWRGRRWFAAPAVALLGLAAWACGGGGASLPDVTPVGFLPIPTSTTAPPEYSPFLHDRSDLCPGYTREACVQPGDRWNPFRVLHLGDASAVMVFHGGELRSVLDPADVRRALRMLDSDVTTEEYRLTGDILLEVIWLRGEGIPTSSDTRDVLDLFVDEDARLIGVAIDTEAGVQWPLPDGLVDLLLASAEDVTPTREPPLPAPTLVPTPPPTAVLAPPGAVFFDHPEEDVLRWDGPDDRVSSRAYGHCENPRLREEFGVPGVISVNDEGGFWLSDAVRPQDSWRWTGYHHSNWQLWQGDDPFAVYLVHDDEERIAFKYRSFGCS